MLMLNRFSRQLCVSPICLICAFSMALSWTIHGFTVTLVWLWYALGMPHVGSKYGFGIYDVLRSFKNFTKSEWSDNNED